MQAGHTCARVGHTSRPHLEVGGGREGRCAVHGGLRDTEGRVLDMMLEECWTRRSDGGGEDGGGDSHSSHRGVGVEQDRRVRRAKP